MMNDNVIKKMLRALLMCCGLLSFATIAEVLDRMVAVVEDDVILESELNLEVATIIQRMQASKAQLPPEAMLRKQVLEKLIMDKLQRLMAEKAGITVSEEMLTTSALEIAERNHLSLEQFRAELQNQGMSYKAFLDNMRNEIIINQLRGRELGGRIKVTDREVDHYLETEGKVGSEDINYRLGHILVAVREGASATDIKKAQAKVDQVLEKLREGQDFGKLAMSYSDDANALKGGDLGWRALRDIPSLFSEGITRMQEGQVADAIRSPSGFHIIKF
jgi:peptidyl-prolyl cis-trans isomerase SurA